MGKDDGDHSKASKPDLKGKIDKPWNTRKIVLVVVIAIVVMAVRNWLQGCTCTERLDMKGMGVIITGASDGIGLETAKRLYALGAELVLPARNVTKAKIAVQAISASNPTRKGAGLTIKEMDLNSLASVRKFVTEFHKMKLSLDILINNAGIWPTDHVETEDGLQETFQRLTLELTWELRYAAAQANHLSHFLLSNLLLDDLRKTAETRKRPSRIVTLSSALHRGGKADVALLNKGQVLPKDAYTNGMQGYSNAKLLNVIFAKELQRRIDDSPVYKGKITSTSVHPGVINTSLHRSDKVKAPFIYYVMRSLFGVLGKSVEQGAQTSVYAAISKAIEGKGGVYSTNQTDGVPLVTVENCGVATHNPLANNATLANEVWALSVRLSKLGKGAL